MANTISRQQLKQIMREVIIREGTMGMGKKELEKLDKVRKSSRTRREFLKKAGAAGLGIMALSYLYRLGSSGSSKRQ